MVRGVVRLPKLSEGTENLGSMGGSGACNEMLFWETVWGLPFCPRTFPDMHLTLFHQRGWLLSVLERVLRAIVFGVFASVIVPGYPSEQWRALRKLQSQKPTTFREGNWRYQRFKKCALMVFVLICGILAVLASASLLQEAYTLLQQRAVF